MAYRRFQLSTARITGREARGDLPAIAGCVIIILAVNRRRRAASYRIVAVCSGLPEGAITSSIFRLLRHLAAIFKVDFSGAAGFGRIDNRSHDLILLVGTR
jgi:hypothetical protein